MKPLPDKWSVDPNVARLVPGTPPDACRDCPVRAMSFCSELTPDDLARLDKITSSADVAPPQALVYEGDPARHAFNVTAGVLRLIKMLPDGRRQITGFLFPGDFLGLANRGSYPYSAEAITPVTLCRYERDKLLDLSRHTPALEHRFLRIATDELAAAQDQMLLLGRKTARERVASFLLWMSRQAERRGAPENPVDLPMARSDIADYLGLTIETVSRTMTKLSKDGAIRLITANYVEITDPDLLAVIESGDVA